MIRYDYTDYAERLSTLDYSFEELHQRAEAFRNYVKLIQGFDPMHHPPAGEDRYPFIMNVLIPILQEYCRDLQAVLEIHEETGGVQTNIICDCMIVIKDEKEFRDILYYADQFSVKPYDQGRIIFSLYFAV